jgi:hypothetical protein
VGNKMLRKIYGSIYEIDSWTIKMNQEIYKKFKSAGIVTASKLRIMEWSGHIVRIVQRLLGSKPGGGRRKQGRSRLRWMDDAELQHNGPSCIRDFRLPPRC